MKTVYSAPLNERKVMRAAVTGASGCIGRVLVEQLVNQGPVKALRRHPGATAVEGFEYDCEPVAGDLEDTRALQQLVRDVDVVYHCAATMGKSDPRLSERVNVVGTENVVRAALDAGVRRFVYVSSISVFAATPRANGTITEAIEPTNLRRLNHYSRTKLEGELLVRGLAADGLAFTIIRPTNVYGPWSRPWFTQWAELLQRTSIAFGDLPIDVVYVADVATAMLQAAHSAAAENETFHIGHQHIAMNEFIRRVGEVVHRPTRRLPAVVDRGLRHAIDVGYRLSTGRHMSMSLTRPVCYPHEKAQRVFGYEPSFDVNRGFAALSEWYAGQCVSAESAPARSSA